MSVELLLSILALVFGFLGFLAGTGAIVVVLGWKHSTHKIQYVQPDETTYQVDAPPEVVDQLPSSPEPETLKQWLRRQQSGLDDLYEQGL